MKKLILFFYLCSVSFFPQSGWNRQYSGTTEDLINTFFTDSLRGVIVGNGGTILVTTDGGDNWAQKNSGTTNHLKFVSYVNEQVGTIVGAGGVILKTEDGGETWIHQTSGVGGLEAVSFYDENNGVAVGGSTIIRTTNGGQNWEILSTGILQSNCYRVHYFDYNNIVIFYDYYSIFSHAGVHKTTDAGITWSSQTVMDHSPYGKLNDAKFINSSTGYMLGWRGRTTGRTGYFLRTTDSGTSWQLVSTIPVASFNSFSFMDINNGTAVGPTGNFYTTTNGGITWNQQFAGNWYNFNNSVFFADNKYGTIVGDNGLIYNTKTDGKNSPQVNWLTSPTDISSDLMSVQFINENTGFCVSSNYYYNDTRYLYYSQLFSGVLKTTNAGINWIPSPLHMAGPFDVWFEDENLGSIVGKSPSRSIYNTFDGGENWETFVFDENLSEMSYRIARGIQYIDSLRRVIVVQYGRIIYTLDGGLTWTKSDSVTAWDLNDLSFPNDEVGYVVGDRGTILKSTDSGISWSVIPTNTNDNLYGVYFTDPNNGFVVGMFGKILKTTDGGITWIQKISGTYNHLFKVVFDLHNNGIIVGEFGTILKTSDGGDTWEREESGTSINLNAVSITNSLAITVGDFGAILRMTDTTLVSDTTKIVIPDKYLLEQNYPNPFNPNTTINYQIPNSGFVTLKIYDLLGREIATLVNEEKPAGSYNAEFTTNNLSSGIYFYRLQAGSFIETKKMILLK